MPALQKVRSKLRLAGRPQAEFQRAWPRSDVRVPVSFGRRRYSCGSSSIFSERNVRWHAVDSLCFAVVARQPSCVTNTWAMMELAWPYSQCSIGARMLSVSEVRRAHRGLSHVRQSDCGNMAKNCSSHENGAFRELENGRPRNSELANQSFWRGTAWRTNNIFLDRERNSGNDAVRCAAQGERRLARSFLPLR